MIYFYKHFEEIKNTYLIGSFTNEYWNTLLERSILELLSERSVDFRGQLALELDKFDEYILIQDENAIQVNLMSARSSMP